MDIAKVTGRVVSTQKDPQLTGNTLLIVSPYDYRNRAFRCEESYVAIDTVGAGRDELVLVARGSAARCHQGQNDGPVDAAVVGIIDQVDLYSEQV